jgi:hypothetical protein
MTRRTRARSAADRRMRELGLNPTDIARAAGITRQAVSGFLAGETWPRPATLSAISRGLSWPPGQLAEIADGSDVELPAPHADHGGSSGRDLVIGWPEQLSAEERAEWEAAVRAEAYRRAREIRASRPS